MDGKPNKPPHASVDPAHKNPSGKQRQAVFAVLDDRLGEDRVEEFRSPKHALDAAVRCIEEHDELMVGCGVGPLMDDIHAWMEEWSAGTRCVAPVSVSPSGSTPSVQTGGGGFNAMSACATRKGRPRRP